MWVGGCLLKTYVGVCCWTNYETMGPWTFYSSYTESSRRLQLFCASLWSPEISVVALSLLYVLLDLVVSLSVISVVILRLFLSTAAVIALFCRQYDIIKDNDSNGTKEKAKRPLVRTTPSYYNASAASSPVYHNGAVRSSRVTHFSSNCWTSFRKVRSIAIVLLQHISIMHDHSWQPGIFGFLWRAFVVASVIA